MKEGVWDERMRRDDARTLAVVFWMHGRGVFDGVDGALSQHGFLDAFVVFHRYSLDPGHDQLLLDSGSMGINVNRPVGFGREHRMRQRLGAYQSSRAYSPQPKHAREWAAAHCCLRDALAGRAR